MFMPNSPSPPRGIAKREGLSNVDHVLNLRPNIVTHRSAGNSGSKGPNYFSGNQRSGKEHILYEGCAVGYFRATWKTNGLATASSLGFLLMEQCSPPQIYLL